MTKTDRLAGGKIIFHLDVTKDVIIAAWINGDFFGNDQADQISRIITGLPPLDRAILINALDSDGAGHAIYGMTSMELVLTILA